MSSKHHISRTSWTPLWYLMGTFIPFQSTSYELAGHDAYPGQSSIQHLPMINILGTKFAFCSLLNSSTTRPSHVPLVITFDQPLYWKHAEIISASPQEIVLRLGTFHTFMNLPGAIGTGLKHIQEVVCGENAVVHMMTGKSVQRAFHNHLLMDNCLHQWLL